MITIITGKPGHGKTLQLVWMMSQYALAGRRIATNVELLPKCPFEGDVLRLDEETRWMTHPDPEKNKEGVIVPVPHQNPVFSKISFPWPGYMKLQTDGGRGAEWYYRAFWHFIPYSWVIAISECSNYFDSLDFARLPDDCRAYWNLHRKLAHTIVMDTQDLDNVYNRLRRVCQTYMISEHTALVKSIWKFLPITWSRFNRATFCSQWMKESDLMEENYMTWKEAQNIFGWYKTDELYGDFAKHMQWGAVEKDIVPIDFRVILKELAHVYKRKT